MVAGTLIIDYYMHSILLTLNFLCVYHHVRLDLRSLPHHKWPIFNEIYGQKRLQATGGENRRRQN
jgi:hypothetical protein